MRVYFTDIASAPCILKPATVKGYLSALKKLKFLLGFKHKKSSALEKILLRGMENIQLSSPETQKQVTPVDLPTLADIKKGMNLQKFPLRRRVQFGP
jgi:hypothetical protein